jgi:hypothetical protein
VRLEQTDHCNNAVGNCQLHIFVENQNGLSITKFKILKIKYFTKKPFLEQQLNKIKFRINNTIQSILLIKVNFFYKKPIKTNFNLF